MKQLIVCINHRANPAQPSCGARGSVLLADHLQQEIIRQEIPITLQRYACLGRCNDGPNLKLAPGGEFISAVTMDQMERVLQQITAFARLPDGGLQADMET